MTSGNLNNSPTRGLSLSKSYKIIEPEQSLNTNGEELRENESEDFKDDDDSNEDEVQI